MGKYNKLWVAALGLIATLLHESGMIDTGQSEALVTNGIALLTAFGVYAVKNTPTDPHVGPR